MELSLTVCQLSTEAVCPYDQLLEFRAVQMKQKRYKLSLRHMLLSCREWPKL